MKKRQPTSASLLLSLFLVLPSCTRDSGKEPVFALRQPERAQVEKNLGEDKARITGYRPQGQMGKLDEYFRKLNRVLLNQNRTQMEAESAMQDLRLAAKRSLEDFGHDEMLRMGTFLLEDFMARLTALIQKANTCDGAVPALLSGAAPPACAFKEYKAFASLGGDFLVLAFANDLVIKKDGKLSLPEKNIFFVRLAFKVRWAHIFPEVSRPVDMLLNDFERLWYEIWVAERSKTASKRRRLQAVNRLKVIKPDYEHLKAAGVICYQTKDYPAAIAAFEAALKGKPKNKTIKAYLAKAKSKVR